MGTGSSISRPRRKTQDLTDLLSLSETSQQLLEALSKGSSIDNHQVSDVLHKYSELGVFREENVVVSNLNERLLALSPEDNLELYYNEYVAAVKRVLHCTSDIIRFEMYVHRSFGTNADSFELAPRAYDCVLSSCVNEVHADFDQALSGIAYSLVHRNNTNTCPLGDPAKEKQLVFTTAFTNADDNDIDVSVVGFPVFEWHGEVGAFVTVLKVGTCDIDAGHYKIIQKMFASSSHILISALRVQQKEIERNQEIELLESLLFITKALFKQKNNLMASLELVISHVQNTVDVDRVSVFILDEEGHELWCKSNEGTGFRVPLVKRSVAGHVLSSGVPLIIPDAYKDDRFNPKYDKLNGYRTRNILCLPIVNERKKVIGVIQAINKHGDGHFSLHDQHLVATVCEELGSLLDVQSLEAVYEMVQNDGRVGVQSMLRMYQQQSNPGHSQDDRSFKNGKSNTFRHRNPESGASDERLEHLHEHGSLESIVGEKGMELVSSWDFNILDTPANDLVVVAERLFEEFFLCQRFDISRNKLFCFLEAVKGNYLPNPYHNWHHGFSVLHSTFMILAKCGAAASLKYENIFGLMIAAVAHDVGHPGTNNAFHVNAGTKYALTYNDQSVLENFHASQTFFLLGKDDCDMLGDMNSDMRVRVRNTIIKGILATDMAHHFNLINRMKERFAKDTAPASPPKEAIRTRLTMIASPKLMSKKSSFYMPSDPDLMRSSPIDRNNPEDRILLVEAIIHASDLNNPILRFDLYEPWANEVVEEFHQQYLEEVKLGLPFQEFMSKPPSDMLAKATLQVNFISFIVQPMWSSMALYFPKLTERLDVLHENKRVWEQMQEKLKIAENSSNNKEAE